MRTPLIPFHFNWKPVSAIAGLTRTNFVFVREYLDSTRGAIQMALLPVYART